jgi:hypothetical protein
MNSLVVVSAPIGFHIFRAPHAGFGSEENPTEADILEILKEDPFFLFQNSIHAANIYS